jgi:hypothetical protein
MIKPKTSQSLLIWAKTINLLSCPASKTMSWNLKEDMLKLNYLNTKSTKA